MDDVREARQVQSPGSRDTGLVCSPQRGSQPRNAEHSRPVSSCAPRCPCSAQRIHGPRGDRSVVEERLNGWTAELQQIGAEGAENHEGAGNAGRLNGSCNCKRISRGGAEPRRGLGQIAARRQRRCRLQKPCCWGRGWRGRVRRLLERDPESSAPRSRGSSVHLRADQLQSAAVPPFPRPRSSPRPPRQSVAVPGARMPAARTRRNEPVPPASRFRPAPPPALPHRVR